MNIIDYINKIQKNINAIFDYDKRGKEFNRIIEELVSYSYNIDEHHKFFNDLFCLSDIINDDMGVLLGGITFKPNRANSYSLTTIYADSYTDAEKFNHSFVFSDEFWSVGLSEPMDQLLFRHKKKKQILKLARDINSYNRDFEFKDVLIALDSYDLESKVDKIISDELVTRKEDIYKNYAFNFKKLTDDIIEDLKKEDKYNTLKQNVETNLDDIIYIPKNKNEGYEISSLTDKLISSFVWNRINGKRYKYIYYIADAVSALDYSSGIWLIAEREISQDVLSTLSLTTDRIFGTFYREVLAYNEFIAHTKSAIGSIMSRNGSHNIGSHVLAALSHNVGTMPDDRVLYQYIQHRMDYIAQVTTDRPTWKQSTMFVATLMKEFLKQKHLLENISGSEGLHAYKFQGQSVNREDEKNTIRLHVRRILTPENYEWEKQGLLNDKDNQYVVNFIKYDDFGNIDFSKDVQVAIPGGLIGQHAFYTVLENILRNAAKHEWAESVRVWKVAKEVLGEKYCLDKFPGCCPKQLDIYIDFRDNSNKGKVECRIWNDRVTSSENMVNISSEILYFWYKEGKIHEIVAPIYNWYLILEKQNYEMPENEVFILIKQTIVSLDRSKCLYSDICNKISEVLQNNSDISKNAFAAFLKEAIAQKMLLHESDLKSKIQQSFIDKEGKLRRENWGIAEMRISAGFLGCRDISHIGGLSGDQLQIIKPVLIKNQNEDMCLGYRFDIDKPKVLLVVLQSESEKIKDVNDFSIKLGIKFIPDSLINEEASYPYSYVLFENLSEARIEDLKTRKIALPFRILCNNNIGKDQRLSKFVSKFNGDFFDKIEENFKSMIESEESSQKICYPLLENVYADWLNHVRSNGNLNGDYVAIDVVGSDTGNSAQALISKEELIKFIFTNTFNAAVRSFLKENGPNDVTGSFEIGDGEDKQICYTSLPIECAVILYAIVEMPYRKVLSLNEMVSEFPDKSDALSADIRTVVECQLEWWMKEILKKYNEIKIYDEAAVENWTTEFSSAIKIGDFDDFIVIPEHGYWMNRFVSFIITVILEQADSFLRKYEERYSTLPKEFKLGSDGKKQEWKWEIGNRKIIKNVVVTSNANNRKFEREENHAICYFRHGDDCLPQISNNYYESMSGAQGMLNTFIDFKRKISNENLSQETQCWCAEFVTRLVENSALRVLIIDERVAKFMRKHKEVANLIGGLRLAVSDDNDPKVMNIFSNFSPNNPPSFSNVKLTDFEIVIIHQGIIDKLLQGHEDKAIVEEWLNRMTNHLHYVIITTGRGTPANIPDTARVLPYSIIENSILQRYPEKMILVDAVMHILPVRQKKNGDEQ